VSRGFDTVSRFALDRLNQPWSALDRLNQPGSALDRLVST